MQKMKTWNIQENWRWMLVLIKAEDESELTRWNGSAICDGILRPHKPD